LDFTRVSARDVNRAFLSSSAEALRVPFPVVAISVPENRDLHRSPPGSLAEQSEKITGAAYEVRNTHSDSGNDGNANMILVPPPFVSAGMNTLSLRTQELCQQVMRHVSEISRIVCLRSRNSCD